MPDDLVVNPDERYKSDHCVLSWTLPRKAMPQPKRAIKRGSQAGVAFVHQCQNAIAAMPEEYDGYESADDVRHWAAHV